MSDPSSPGAAARPLACRLRLHLLGWSDWVVDPSDPCLKLLRCTLCGKVWVSRRLHLAGGEQRRVAGRPCVIMVGCPRCGREEERSACDIRIHAAGRLPLPDGCHPCARLDMCAVCERVAWEGWSHDFPGGWEPCRRCGLARHLADDYSS